MDIKSCLEKIEGYSYDNIELTDYCREKMQQRNIEESLVISTLFSKSLCFVEEQSKDYMGAVEKRHKLIFSISSKYSLIIIVAFYQKDLKVVNVIKTSKRLDKLWKSK